jgi:hypothetical protein
MAITISTTSGSIDVSTASEVFFSFVEPSDIIATAARTIINIEVANSVNAIQ